MSEFGPKTQKLIEALVDLGYERENAQTWIEDVANELTAIPNHSCSCHTQGAGPCGICESLGCQVWDFNHIAVPVY